FLPKAVLGQCGDRRWMGTRSRRWCGSTGATGTRTVSQRCLTCVDLHRLPSPVRGQIQNWHLHKPSWQQPSAPELPGDLCFTLRPWLFWGFNNPWYLHPLPGPLSCACFGTVRRAALCCGLKEAGENEEWTVYWTDYSVSLERVMEMKRFQPFLIDGFKFDMRIYVLVTSCDPLRIFVYKEGLARFATMRYIDPSSRNLDDICMHLTNYAINKHNENFVQDDMTGSKSIHGLSVKLTGWTAALLQGPRAPGGTGPFSRAGFLSQG
uniref:Uncharacterized protein n=1 Tax=Buteo japonicus TaxID=224669 RepID=A0A8C0BMP1_9AVES